MPESADPGTPDGASGSESAETALFAGVVGMVVLDTNVVLDWLLWADPATAALDAAIRSGRWIWTWTPPMAQELDRVLAHRLPGIAAERRSAVTAASRQWARTAGDLPERVHRLICRDPSDQMFIDLAIASGATRLLSRDNEVLRLARAARGHALWIGRPADWPEASRPPRSP